MLYTYFMTAFRTLLRHKGYSVINILGLSVGLASCLLLFLAVQDELTYDSHHQDLDRLFRIAQVNMSEQGKVSGVGMPLPYAPTLKTEVSEVEYSARIAGLGSIAAITTSNGTQKTVMVSAMTTDPDYFKMLGYKFIEGSPETALNTLSSLVLSEEQALRLFGAGPALGKIVSIVLEGKRHDLAVGGVIRNPPSNDSYSPGFVVRVELLPWYNATSTAWDNICCETIVKLRTGAIRQAVNEKLHRFAQIHFAQSIEDGKNTGVKPDENGIYITQFLQSYTDMHFNTEIPIKMQGAGADKSSVYILIGIGILILMIACINFVNLSVARSLERTREVGVRKSLGASKSDIVLQFMGEAGLIVLFAFVVSIGVAELAMSYFNTMVGKQLSLLNGFNLMFIGTMLAVVLLTVFGAGSYPALYIARFEASVALKELARGNKISFVRSMLVIMQFTIAVVLICCTIVMREQMQYMVKKDLGFAKDQLIAIPLGDGGNATLGRLKQELRSVSFVQSVAGSSENIGRGLDGSLYMSKIATIDRGKVIRFNQLTGSTNYAHTLGLTLLAGKDIADNMGEREVLINTSMVRQLNEIYGERPLENMIGMKIGSDSNPPRVIGIVNDYHFRALRQQIEPLIIAPSKNIDGYRYAFVRVSGDMTPATITMMLETLKNVWNKVQPDKEFQASLANENLERLYRSEQRMHRLVMVGSAMAILLACMGLFALTTLIITHRTKEIGVRKVLGASEWSIVRLLVSDFTRLVGIAIGVAVPLAWYAMDHWIKDYMYRITLSPLLFTVGGVLALMIAIMTISIQALRAARINPVRALKTE